MKESFEIYKAELSAVRAMEKFCVVGWLAREGRLG
jgi:hypothetical protein